MSGSTATGGLSMHGKNLRRAAGLGILTILICVPARAQQQNSQQSGTGDPVADAARKAREEKKETPKPKKVYTEDDISTKKSDISVVGNPAPQGDPAATSSTTVANPVAQGNMTPEQQWRKRFADQRAKIVRAEQELDVLQREENKAGLQYSSDPTKAMKEQLTRNEINLKAAKIEAKKKEIAALKQQTDDVEDELRKAGGDPGWAR